MREKVGLERQVRWGLWDERGRELVWERQAPDQIAVIKKRENGPGEERLWKKVGSRKW